MADFFDKFKKAIGFSYDYEYEDEYENEDVQPVTSEDSQQVQKPQRQRSRASLGGADLIITVQEPLSYDESAKVADDLINNKAVVLNFEQLDNDVKGRIFDFVSGAVYALNGKMQKVNKDIFIIAPEKVEVDGVKEELKNQGMFPW